MEAENVLKELKSVICCLWAFFVSLELEKDHEKELLRLEPEIYLFVA